MLCDIHTLCINIIIISSGGYRPPSLVGGGGGDWSVYFSESLFQGLSKNMCQPAINGGEQSEKSHQILITSFFGQICDIFGGALFGKL
jgi:hypothetical protein